MFFRLPSCNIFFGCTKLSFILLSLGALRNISSAVSRMYLSLFSMMVRELSVGSFILERIFRWSHGYACDMIILSFLRCLQLSRVL